MSSCWCAPLLAAVVPDRMALYTTGLKGCEEVRRCVKRFGEGVPEGHTLRRRCGGAVRGRQGGKEAEAQLG